MACDDVNAIMVGYRGRVAMLKACFSKSDDPPTPTPTKQSPKAIGQKLRSFAKSHNARIDRKRGK